MTCFHARPGPCFPFTEGLSTASSASGCKADFHGAAYLHTPCSSPPTMAEVLGVASSVTTLIGNIVTLTKYVKDVINAPEEITQFTKEPARLEICLTALRGLIQLSTEEDPWLKTLKQLFAPPVDAPGRCSGRSFQRA